MHDHVDSLLPNFDFDRRQVMSGLAAGFALAVQPISAQTITTDTGAIEAGEVKIPAGDIDMPAYRAMPAKGKHFPVVLVVKEIFGVHEHIKDVCRRFAKLGYLAVAPALYARQGDVSNIPDIQEVISKVVSKVPDAQVMSDLDAAVEWAAQNQGDTKRLGITGFCWGGRITWLYAAHQPKLKAGVAWYGGLMARAGAPANPLTPKHPLDLVAELKSPVLGLYGEADQGIPVASVEKMRDALKAAGKEGELVLYPNGPHGFHADYRPSYRKEMAEDGWKRLLAWFRKYGVA